MLVEPIQNLDDPRVWAYRNLKDRELARQGQRFIAEGEHLVRRLLKSDFAVELPSIRVTAYTGLFGNNCGNNYP